MRRSPATPADARVVLDLSGLTCPHLVLELAAALRPLGTGTVVTVTATDPLSAVDVPFYVDRHGHRLLSRVREAERIVFTIECGPGRTPHPA